MGELKASNKINTTPSFISFNGIELALTASGCDQAVVRNKPGRPSDNGSCYISGDLAEWQEDYNWHRSHSTLGNLTLMELLQRKTMDKMVA